MGNNGKLLDLSGQRYGKLTVLDEHEIRRHPGGTTSAYWKCRCDCGTVKYVCAKSLRNGDSVSCGCTQHTHPRRKGTGPNGQSLRKMRLYNIWRGMKQRCRTRKNYRNVKICKEWESFTTFYEWAMANGYRDDLSIDRIDNNGNYEPSNCRWATTVQQANNTSQNLIITIDGITHTAMEWTRILKIPYQSFIRRLDNGWDVKRAIFTPHMSGIVYPFKSDPMNIDIADYGRILRRSYV